MKGNQLGAAVLVAVLTLAVRAYPALNLGNHGPDFENYRQMGDATLRGDDVYASHPLFPYMPYSQVIPAACVGLGERLGIPFQSLLKLVAVAGDIVLAVALLLALRRRAPPRTALLWTLAFALNPVSVLVSAFHGNLMALVPVFVGLAMVAGDFADEVPATGRPTVVATAALLLGIAVALRSFPVLLVPAFALWLSRSLREAARFSAVALVPSAFSALPYLVFSAPDFLREVLSYSGATDLGWLAALRAVPLLLADVKLFSFGGGLLGASKALFLASWALSVALLPSLRAEGRRRAVLLPPLLFVGLYGGVAAQYLVWLLPAAVLTRDRWLLGYTAFATVAMTSFYLVYHPSILFAAPPSASPEGPLVHLALVLGNAALAVHCSAWSARIVRDELRGASPRSRRLALVGGLILSVVFAGLLARGVVETGRALAAPAVALPG